MAVVYHQQEYRKQWHTLLSILLAHPQNGHELKQPPARMQPSVTLMRSMMSTMKKTLLEGISSTI
jgi:hypothetical protein